MFDWLRRKQHQALQTDEDFFLLTWDSCRYDAYLAANTPVLDAITKPRRAATTGTVDRPCFSTPRTERYWPASFGERWREKRSFLAV